MTVNENRAWLFQKAGEPLLLGSLPLPILQDDEILVANRAIGINPVDWKFIHANPLQWQKGHIPGVDGAGEVLQAGEAVNPELIGQNVAYHQSLILPGSFAAYTILKADRVMQIPQGFPFALAASLPCPMLTAWQAFSKVPINPGKSVLVVGVGAVNRIVAQLLSGAGFDVHALSDSLSESQATALGIHRLFRKAGELKPQYFAIFDAVSEASAASHVPHLKSNGHIVCIQDRINRPVDPAFTRNISYHEVGLGPLHQFGDSEDWACLMRDGEALLQRIQRGELLIEHPAEFAFEAFPEALHHSETTKQKTIVIV